MLSSERGYPLQWFVDSRSVDDYLKCGICSNVLREPRATRCGHVYCLSCLLGWIDAYGICPQRCGEVEADQMKRALHIEKRISGLLTLCKYQQYGCTVQVPLADKALHESTCPYNKPRRLTKSVSYQLQADSIDGFESAINKQFKANAKRSRSSAGTGAVHRIVQTKSGATTKRSPSLHATRTCQLQFQQHIPTGMNQPFAAMQGTSLSFRLKRARAKEPLGLVLVCGEKTPEGRPLSFYVKKVNPDTLGWRAGIEAGDRIVQVDFHDLARIDPQEAVARIKDKPIVSLTVLRGFPKPGHLTRTKSDQEHIYDEILYTDALSQQDENFPPVMSAAISALNARRHHRAAMAAEDQPIRSSKAAHKRPVSPGGNTFFRTSSGPPAPKHQSHHRSHRSHHVHPAGESNGSKDSGLSSGSSGTGRHRQDEITGQPNHHVVGDLQAFERSIYERRSGRADHSVTRKLMFVENGRRASESSIPPSMRRNCRIEGDYEVEEIYLEKNGTSQLGITLGYDVQTPKRHLYVCEILPTGLAAQDGRLHCGDIIRRVNGFEVYDPEEAVLLFLEQDQDITLTVARKIKQPPSHQRLNTSPPRDFSHSQPEGDHNYAVLESTAPVVDPRLMRRIDSCGSLDSHSHRYLSENRRHLHTPPVDSAHFRPINGVRVNMDEEEGYEVLNRHRSGSSASSLLRPGDSRKCNSPPTTNSPRNPSPLCIESNSVFHSPIPTSLSPDYSTIQLDNHLSASDCQFRPIPSGESRMRPRTSSHDRYISKTPSGVARPSSTTPGSRNRINSRGSGGEPCEPKIMSPLSPTRKVPQSFKTLSSELNKLPSRCDPQPQVDLMFSRSESLV